MNEEIFPTSSKISIKNLKNGKRMEWWVLAPLVFAVLIFLLVGTIFEKRIEEKIKNFINNHFSHEENPGNMTTQANANQTNLPTNPQTQNNCERCPNPPTQNPCESCTRDKAKSDNKPDTTPTEGPKDKSAAPAQENQVQLISFSNGALKPKEIETDSNVRTSLSKTSRIAVRSRSRHLAPEIQ
ncbi:hypothetical protein O0L34_g11029 [Tuta absoluta]|nr:hypothetical protein O0L34_g11029 [Tuta absoluta]